MSAATSPPPVAVVESPVSNGRQLRIEFFQHRDRYGHRVVVVDHTDGIEFLLLTSGEGTDTDCWPPSPPLQCLNLEDLASIDSKDDPPAMLIGMAGHGHWSMSVQRDTLTSHAAASGRIVFDVACRLRSTKRPRALCSTYTLGGAATVTRCGSGVEIGRAGAVCRVLPATIGGSESCEMVRRGDELQVHKNIEVSETAPLTVRWRYAMELSA